MTVMERILRKVERRRESVLVPDECWVWTGATNGGCRGGYGHIKIGGTRTTPRLVHRVMFELVRGPLAADEKLDHLCAVRLCCNPDHLELVTNQENIRRGYARRRLLAEAA